MSTRSAKKNSITYAPHGALLKEEGFHDIVPLADGEVTVEQLEKWVGMKPGIAISVLRYARDDYKAIKAGTYVPPMENEVVQDEDWEGMYLN
jgi:hypothetical protein